MEHRGCSWPVFLISVLIVSSSGAAVKQTARTHASTNPIRKVVTLLQAMQKKVEDEGEAEKKLYEKYMCYCKTGGSDLSASISDAESKIGSLPSEIEAAEGKLGQLKEDVKQAQTDRRAAKDAIAKATAIREKAAAAFAAEKTEYDSTIVAITKAVAALEKGVAGGFLQTGAAQVLRQLLLHKEDVLDGDRQELVSFLSGDAGYAPKSGEIIGILKQMGDTMAKSLEDATATEEESIKEYQELMSAKTKEVEALTASIETKMTQIGELGVEIVEMKEDLTDTEVGYMEDKTFLANLEKNCATKTAEWEERSKTRAEELVALADTIKVLNDDDALELFKKTLPSAGASFVQMAVTSSLLRDRALSSLRSAQKAAGRQHRPGLDFLVLALTGKKALNQGGFDKVIKMCDEMVKELQKEQQDDEDKKEYCAAQFDVSEDKQKALERAVSDEDNEIAKATDGIATLAEEIEALEAGIVALDKSVVEATEQRKEENEEYKELMATDTAAKKLLEFAKNRLNKFYNPKLYKAPPKTELSAENRIYENMGGTITAAAPGGIADTGIAFLVQVSSHSESKEAPPPPPESWDAYAKKSEESTGVMAMLDLLMKDLDKQMTEAETDEKNGQSDYETMMKESAEKRTVDSKTLAEKEGAKADLEKALEEHKEVKKDTTSELMATLEYIQSLHTECDWLLKYFDVRKEARTSEIDAILKAKAVLSGADYSLLQVRSHRFLRGSP